MYRHLQDKRKTQLLLGGASSNPPAAPSSPPAIESFVVSKTSSNSTILDIAVPTGLSPGDLWLIVMGVDGQRTLVDGGGTLTLEDDNGASDTPAIDVYSKIADGMESTVSITWSGQEQALAWSLRISGHNGYDIGAFNNNAAAAYNSPNITPNFDNSLVIQVAIADDNNSALFDITSIPTVGYTELGSQTRNGGSQGLVSRLVYGTESDTLVTGGPWEQESSRNSSVATLVIAPS